MQRIVAVLLVFLAYASPSASPPVWAAAREAAPRAAVTIGEFSVVLIAADGRIQAFVDRIADNAPADDVVLGLRPRGGGALRFAQAAPGLFVAPFAHAGRIRDSFVVTLAPAAAAAREAPDSAVAELVYGAALAAPPPAPGGWPVQALLWLLGLGGAVAVLGVCWRSVGRGGWRPLFGKQAA